MATKRTGYMTLAEHHAQLKAEGKWDDYVKRKQERDAAIQRLEEEYARAEIPIVEELRAAGLKVNSVWDLVNDPALHPQSLPILLAHLQRAYPDAIREGIARAMAVPQAKFAWPVLLESYLHETQQRTKHGLAVALGNIADDEMMDHIIALLQDPRHGESRGLLLNALERSKLPQAQTALKELASDPVLYKEIRAIQRRKRTTK